MYSLTSNRNLTIHNFLSLGNTFEYLALPETLASMMKTTMAYSHPATKYPVAMEVT